ncbi:MAG TPA: VOC family protein [Candidatus Acidoferrum sp.]|nr:VOC family protein [Candidatus Acidoferrum sp.]
MKSGQLFLTAAILALLTAPAEAQISLNSVRIAAVDSVKLSQFYSKAFGMFEVQRIGGGANPEVFVNFGATAAEAKANKAPPVVIMHRDADSTADTVAHVIFTVTDVKAVAAAVKAAGGSMDREPFEFQNSGTWIGLAKDPVGNAIELIQQPKK